MIGIDSLPARYVILEHDWPELHWDLMLERSDVLWSWRLSSKPENGIAIPCERIADHRPFYLDYEGPVSGDRGTVTRIAAGVYETVDVSGELKHPRCISLILDDGPSRRRCDIYEREILLSCAD